jgi:IS30 family transposase
MYQRIQTSGGMRPTIPERAARHLTFEDREEISRGLAADDSLRQIAVGPGRSPSTISREVKADGGRSATGRHARTEPRNSVAAGRRRASQVRTGQTLQT